MLDHQNRITFASELTEIFTTDELKTAISNVNEHLYEPGSLISSKEERGKYIYFTARGMIIEKNGRLEDHYEPQVKCNKGKIAALQNLLPGFEENF